MLRPLGNLVFVEPIEQKNTTASGIILPEVRMGYSVRGKVIAVGQGRVLDNGQVVPICVKVGDEIVYGAGSASQIEVDGEQIVVLGAEGIVGVFEKPLKN